MTADMKREFERFRQWWKTQKLDDERPDHAAWDAWWEAVRDATDEEIIEVLLPDQQQKAEISRLRAALREIEGGTHPLAMVRVAREALGKEKS